MCCLVYLDRFILNILFFKRWKLSHCDFLILEFLSIEDWDYFLANASINLVDVVSPAQGGASGYTCYKSSICNRSFAAVLHNQQAYGIKFTIAL